MHITDLLLKYNSPLFAPADSEGGAAPATAEPAAEAPPATALGGDAGGQGDETTTGGASDPAKSGDDGEQPASNADAAPTEFNMTAPEGLEHFQGEFDAYTSDATTWMQENPNATAADALKWAAERQAAAVSEQSQDAQTAFQTQITTWENEAKSDKDIGGDAYDRNVATAMVAIKEYGSPELTEILNQSGLGSHPAMIKFALKAAGPLQDGTVIKTNDGSAKKSFAETLYPKS